MGAALDRIQHREYVSSIAPAQTSHSVHIGLAFLQVNIVRPKKIGRAFSEEKAPRITD
jgi:hypothetical protein